LNATDSQEQGRQQQASRLAGRNGTGMEESAGWISSSRHLPFLAQINQLISPGALYRNKLLQRVIHCTMLYCCSAELL